MMTIRVGRAGANPNAFAFACCGAVLNSALGGSLPCVQNKQLR